MEVNELHPFLQELIRQRQRQRPMLFSSVETNDGQINPNSIDSFDWGLTPEGFDFWAALNDAQDQYELGIWAGMFTVQSRMEELGFLKLKNKI